MEPRFLLGKRGFFALIGGKCEGLVTTHCGRSSFVSANACSAAGGSPSAQCERFAAGHQTAFDSVTCADPKAVTLVTAAVRFRGVGSYRTEDRSSSCLTGSADPLQITAL